MKKEKNENQFDTQSAEQIGSIIALQSRVKELELELQQTKQLLHKCVCNEKALFEASEKELQLPSLEYDQSKAELFWNLSHELRTPLNVILSSLQLLDGYMLEEDITKNIVKIIKHKHIMKKNCYRLIRLVNNIIDITRMDTGFFDIKLSNYDIVYLVEEITLAVAHYVDDRDVTVLFDTDIEEKIILCDPDLIERTLLNLLSNSIKCTKPGDTIAVSVQDHDQSIRIIVRDTGIGIQEDKLPIIFERFQQADKSLTRIHEGSGVGLSIVKALVEMHGGTISVSSEYGKGTELVIELPAAANIELDEIAITKLDANRDNAEKIQIEFSDIYK